MRRLLAFLLTIGTLVLTTATPAAAFEPVTIVHTERVQVGPYGMTVGFSRWPIRAMQSLDFTFAPDGGHAGRSGFVDAGLPDGSAVERWNLARHPRKLEVWGLNIQALPAAGPWTFRITVNGPEGTGEGSLTGIPVLAQPGPPLALSWSVAGLPVLALLAFATIAWRRTRPERRQLSASTEG
jgi:hypothetical protein